jgi:tetratricopeptide (TPR) repeat protein
LALHPGPDFGSRAAATLVAVDTQEVRHWLDVLTGAHLLEQYAHDRYQFHDLLWSFAMDQARREEPPESRRVLSRRVLCWYLRTADQAQNRINPNEPHVAFDPLDNDPEPIVFDSYTEAVGWYELERSNLVAATKAAAEMGLHEIAWRLAIVLRAIYMRFNRFDDWIVTADIGLQAARQTADRSAEAELLESLGMAYAQSHELRRSAEYHQAALDIRRDLGDRTGEALSLNDLGLVYLRTHQLDKARRMFEQSLAIFEDLADSSWVPIVMANLGEILAELGQYAEAENLVGSALETFRESGDLGGEGNALRLLSLSRRGRGDAAGALQVAEAAVAISVEHHNEMWEGYWLLELGRAQHLAGHFEDALVAYDRAALLQRRIGDRAREALAWDATGELHRELGRFEEAIELHIRAAEVFRSLEVRWPQATSLVGLAGAQRAAGLHASADETSAEALRLLAEFTDPSAQAMKARIRETG